jgi:TrmH family RNA methyltransferase
MIIESTSNNKIKDIRKLNEKKYRDEEKKYIIEGEHLVLEAYKAGNLEEVILCDRDIDLDVEKIFVTESVMKTISTLPSKVDIIGICSLKENDIDLSKNILILDGVQDPGNLGTILRSAVAFNLTNIILSEDTVDLYNIKTLRSAQGMNFHLNIKRTNLEEYIPFLKENGYKIWGTDVTNGIDIKNASKDEKYAIIMGNEGKGMSANIKELCDKFVYVNMNENCESLNVGVCASIIMYELNK